MEEKKEPSVLIKLISISFPILEIFIFLASIELVGGGYVLGWTFLSVILGYIGVKANLLKNVPAQSLMLFVFRTDVAIYDPEIISYYLLKIGFILLIVPGLATDLLGILLIVKPLRVWLSNKFSDSKVKNELKKK